MSGEKISGSPAIADIGIALTAPLAATGLRALIVPLLEHRLPFITFFPAIVASAWYGGLWPGLLCTGASTAVVAFSPPAGWLELGDHGGGLGLGLFMAIGATISALNEALHRERARHRGALREATRAGAAEQEARRAAERASRAKDEFLSLLSHELRTPLTPILGWTSVLLAEPPEPDELTRGLMAIERSAKAQARLVEDLFDVSRIISGKFQIERHAVDACAIVRAALDVVRHAADAKGVALDVSLDEEGCSIVADPDRLQQVLWNLLSNAIKFTPRGGRIEVRLEREESSLVITVKDTGQGMDPGFLPHVFERFMQADASTSRAHGGLGLGLAIAKHLVDLHGGSIAAESEGRGRGAKFTVTLPSGRTSAPPASPL